MQEKISYLKTTKQSYFWTWVKLALILVVALSFVALIGVEASEDSEINVTTDCGDNLVDEQIEYLRRGIDIWNKSNEYDEVLLQAVYELSLSLKVSDECIEIIPVENLNGLMETLEKKSVDKVKIVNGQIKALNRSGLIEPTKTLEVREKNETSGELVNDFSLECSVVSEILEEINLGDKVVDQEDILFMRKLAEIIGIEFPELESWQVGYAEIYIEKSLENIDCELDISDQNDTETEDKEVKSYLCEDGSIVEDQLLCPL